MADLRIVDAPVLLQESITDDVKMPTGGLGNFSVRLGDILWYVITKEQLANKSYVDLSSKGVKDSLDNHIADKANPHQVTKEQVGLGNVDNTADVDKPVSNATKSAIITATNDMATKDYVNQKDNLKADKATTLSGYGIADAYNKNETYSKTEINTSLSSKASVNYVDSKDGDLTTLKTVNKTTLVQAVNEVYDSSKGVVDLYAKNIAAGAGVNGWTDLLIATENGRTQRDKNNELKSIVDFGGVGDGVTNNTQAFINAFKATNNLLIPSGIWLVNTIEIPSDVTIVTHGFSTVIKHKAVDDEQRCIVVKGSNVSIGDMTIIGNIATDKYEFHAAVEIHAKTNNIKNVTIGSIIAKDVRGDGLIIASNSGYLASDITVKSVYCDNVLRNGVSICGGNNIRIGSVSGKNVGFAILDLEPEPYNTPTTNVIVDYVQGRYVGVNSASSDTYCDNVTIKNLELNGTLSSSNPVYQQGTTVVDAINVRNTKNLIINNATISNYSRHVLFVIYNNGELGLKNLKIDNLTVSNCSLNDTTYNAYLNGANLSAITINKLTADLSNQQSKEILLNFKEAVINSAEIKLGSNCNVLRNTPNSKLSNVSNTNNLGCLVMGGSNNTTITNCTGTYGYITSYSDKCTIINSTLTATSYIADSNNQNHIVINSTLNGKYYTYGTLKDGYQSAILLGGTYLWFDNTGTMRYKYGQPTSDTDGTAVAKVQ